jgi:hypothetical protein
MKKQKEINFWETKWFAIWLELARGTYDGK